MILSSIRDQELRLPSYINVFIIAHNYVDDITFLFNLSIFV